jgi:hypothetical protein
VLSLHFVNTCKTKVVVTLLVVVTKLAVRIEQDNEETRKAIRAGPASGTPKIAPGLVNAEDKLVDPEVVAAVANLTDRFH